MYKSPTRRNATVGTSYYTLARTFKSPPFVMIAALLRSRANIKAKSETGHRTIPGTRTRQATASRTQSPAQRTAHRGQPAHSDFTTATRRGTGVGQLASRSTCRHTWLWPDHDRPGSQSCHVDRLSTGRPSHPNLLQCVWIVLDAIAMERHVPPEYLLGILGTET